MKEASASQWVRKSPASAPPASQKADAAPIRVLLAEDTAISADMMQAMAQRLSIRMDVAANGVEAIECVHAAIAEGKPYSLLLLDIMMPILDGVETAIRLRASGISAEELPIIAITAATDFDEIRSYRQAGMQAFLEKPVALADLKATLQAWGHRTRSRTRAMRPSALDALAEQFGQRKINTLAAIRTALEADRLDEDSVLELRRILHQLAGTAGSFGEPELGEEARTLEVELMATFFDNGDLRDVLERAAWAIEQRV